MSSGEVKRGRPLDPEIDDAIVAAAGTMLREGGLQRMTIPGVAAIVGVAKTTVYRRYATTVELALVAIGRMNAESVDPDTGSARTDLLHTLEAVRMRIDPTVTATVLVEAQTHPEILEKARETMFGPAVERFRRVLRKGVERGELKRRPRRRPRRRRLAGQLLHLLLRARPPRAGVARRRRERAVPGADGQGGIRTRDGVINPILA